MTLINVITVNAKRYIQEYNYGGHRSRVCIAISLFKRHIPDFVSVPSSAPKIQNVLANEFGATIMSV